MGGWPRTREALETFQRELSESRPPPWTPPVEPIVIGATFVAFSTTRDPWPVGRAWAAAVRGAARVVVCGEVTEPYEPGYLALREGSLLEEAVRGLAASPDVLLVNASGRDHPRGAGLALHLGAVLDLPTVGVTDRPLVAAPDASGALLLDGEVVGYLVRIDPRVRPLCVHAAWRTDAGTARDLVLASAGRVRTPEPLRRARFCARSQRARDEGRLPPGWRMDGSGEPRFPTGRSVRVSRGGADG